MSQLTDMDRIALSKRLLAALRPSWVQETFHISATVKNAQWAKTGIPPARLPEVLEAVRSLTMTEEEAASPEWTRRLDETLDLEFRRLRTDLIDRVSSRIADLVAGQRPESLSSGEAPNGTLGGRSGLEGSARDPEP